ncbi:DNA primase [bacterium BMS3Abin09]|nr:DNA primase [bacterium BMS3Abin09]
MPSYDDTLEEIKNSIDIVELISEYVHLKKAGQNWKGLCPFHTEKTPSFTVSPAKQIFHCFGCGAGGDIFTFLTRYETLTFPEALNMLAKKAGVTLKVSPKSAVRAGEKEVLINMHKDAADFFSQNLPKNPKAAAYLRDRGIDKENLDAFGLGFAPKSWNALLNYLKRKGYKPENIKKAGLAVQGDKGHYDTFRERIMFPIHDLRGDVIAFGGRSIDGSEPKYLNSPETPIFNKRRVLYGLNRAKDSIKKNGSALFMEGYLDVITAHMFGFSNAVAALGTAITPDHGKLIKRFVEDVVIVFDSDPAGIKASRSAAAILLESGLEVKILSVPDNEDPDSFLRKKGKEAFKALLKYPSHVIDFFVKHGGKKHIVADEVFEVVAKMPNEILQEEYITRLADIIDVDEHRVRERFRKKRTQLKSGHMGQQPQTKTRSGQRPRNEIYLIQLLLQMPERVKEISGTLSGDDFKDGTLRSIYRKIIEGPTDLNDLIMKCEGEEKDVLSGISLSPELEDPEKVLSDCIRWMNESKRGMLKRELQVKIKEAEAKKDLVLLKQLQTDFQKLLRTGKQQ